MITKQYIIESEIPLTNNVSDNKVDPYVPVAIEELRAILPDALLADLYGYYNAYPDEWSKTNTYASGGKVLHAENGQLKAWESLTTNTDSEPTTANDTDWTEKKLGTLLVGFVQPFLAHHVFNAYAVNGGVNITHQGLQQVSNETAQPVTGNTLSAFLNYWNDQKRMKRKLMINYIDTNNETFDGTTYTAIDADRKVSKFRIRAIRKQD